MSPRRRQETQNEPQEGPKSRQERPRSTPEGPQEPPEAPQERAKSRKIRAFTSRSLKKTRILRVPARLPTASRKVPCIPCFPVRNHRKTPVWPCSLAPKCSQHEGNEGFAAPKHVNTGSRRAKTAPDAKVVVRMGCIMSRVSRCFGGSGGRKIHENSCFRVEGCAKS